MKILHINSASGMGGASVSVELLHRGLQQQENIFSKLLVGNLYLPDRQDVAALSSKWKRWLNVAITRVSGLDSIWYPFVGRRKIKELVDWADVVHIHNLHGYYFSLRLLRLMQNKPVVWTLRDYWLITGRCAYFKNCSHWLNGCGNCPDRKSYPSTWCWDFSRLMAKLKQRYIADLKNITFVTVSKQLYQVIGKSYLQKYPVEVIYNAIHLPEVERIAENGKRIIVYCAMYLKDTIKGYNKFYQILRALKEKQKYRIIMFGSFIPAGDKRTLSGLGLEVDERGYVEKRSEVAKLLHSADLFVTTSLDEAFGKTAIEALWCGVPIMCFDIPIMREMGDKYALYSPAFDINAFAGNIENFFQVPYPYPVEGLQRYAQGFSVPRMIRSYLDLYQRMIQS